MASGTLSKAVESAANKAIFVLQYNTNKAAQFVCTEVPSTPFDLAVDAINQVARPRVAGKN